MNTHVCAILFTFHTIMKTFLHLVETGLFSRKYFKGSNLSSILRRNNRYENIFEGFFLAKKLISISHSTRRIHEHASG